MFKALENTKVGSLEGIDDNYVPSGGVAVACRTYNKCANILRDAMNVAGIPIEIVGVSPTDRFWSCIEQIVQALGKAEGESVEQLSFRARSLDDISPNQIMPALNATALDLRSKIPEGEHRWVLARKFSRLALNLLEKQEITAKKIIVTNGNFFRLYAYLNELVDSVEFVEWHGTGVNINTAKIRIKNY